MSEPARKTDIDIAEFERRLRPIAPRAEDPLAELARLVGGPPEPRKPAQPIDALSPQARSALTAEEELFLNELSLAVDRAPAARGPALADDPLARAHAAIGKVAAEARAAEAKSAEAKSAEAECVDVGSDDVAGGEAKVMQLASASVSPSPPAALAPSTDEPAKPAALVVEPGPAAIVIPALKAGVGLRGGLDMRGLEEMTRLEDIARVAPPAAEEAPALPKVDLHAPVFARPHAAQPVASSPPPAVVAAPASPIDSIRFEAPTGAPRDLDAPLPGDDGFEAATPALAAAAAGERRPRSRRAMAAVVALLGVGVAATGVALTLKRGPSAANGEPPTILASADPVKVAPPAAPAAPADQADDLLARKGARADGAAKAVGRPEEPVDLAKEAQKIVRTVPVAAALDPNIPRTPTGDNAAPDRLGSVFPEPRRVRTVSVRPDGSIVGAEAGAPATKPAAAPEPAPAPVAAPAKPNAAPSRAEVAAVTPPSADVAAPSRGVLAEDQPAARQRPRAAAPATQTPAVAPAPKRAVAAAKPAPEKPAAEKPAPARRAAVPAAAPQAEAEAPEAEAPIEQVRNPFANLFGRKDEQTAPAAAPTTTASTGAADGADDEAPARPAARAALGSGSYGVQLSSSPSESDARAAANRLAGRFSGALGGRAPRVVKGEAGGKTVYRVRVGGMSKEGAAASCGDVKAAGGNCFVTRD